MGAEASSPRAKSEPNPCGMAAKDHDLLDVAKRARLAGRVGLVRYGFGIAVSTLDRRLFAGT